jgi:hypothetical protein
MARQITQISKNQQTSTPAHSVVLKKIVMGSVYTEGFNRPGGGGTHLRDVTDGGLRLGSPGLAAEETTTARCSLLLSGTSVAVAATTWPDERLVPDLLRRRGWSVGGCNT